MLKGSARCPSLTPGFGCNPLRALQPPKEKSQKSLRRPEQRDHPKAWNTIGAKFGKIITLHNFIVFELIWLLPRHGGTHCGTAQSSIYRENSKLLSVDLPGWVCSGTTSAQEQVLLRVNTIGAKIITLDNVISGTKKEPKPKLLSPDIFWWGGGLPREGVGAKKFGMSLETQWIKLVWRDIPEFCWDIPEAPKKFEKKMFGFNSRPLLLYSNEFPRLCNNLVPT